MSLRDQIAKLALENPIHRAALVPILKEAEGFMIGPGGLEKPKRIKLEANTIHYIGASSDPSMIVVTKADEEWIEYLQEMGHGSGKAKSRRIEAWVGEDLIFKGDATWLKTYASRVTKYESWKKIQPGSKVNPSQFFKGREKVQVTVDAVAPANKYPRNDPWYGAEEYGGVGGLEKGDGSMQYRIDMSNDGLDKLKKDKRFKVVKTQKRGSVQRTAHDRFHVEVARLAQGNAEMRSLLVPLMKEASKPVFAAITMKDVEKINAFTDRNFHPEAALLLAEKLGLKKPAKVLKQLKDLQETLGYASNEILDLRRQAMRGVYDKAKKTMMKDDAGNMVVVFDQLM